MNGTSPAEIERGCSVAAVAFSDGRRQGARLVSGDRRSFTTTVARTVVHVPHPPIASTWTRRSLTCGVALQCAPSKDRVALIALDRLTPREGAALSIVEAELVLECDGEVANRAGGSADGQGSQRSDGTARRRDGHEGGDGA